MEIGLETSPSKRKNLIKNSFHKRFIHENRHFSHLFLIFLSLKDVNLFQKDDELIE